MQWIATEPLKRTIRHQIKNTKIGEDKEMPRTKKSDKVEVIVIDGNRKSKYKRKSSVTRAKKEIRDIQTERQKKWKEIWDNVQIISAEAEESFYVKFLPAIYLGKRGDVVGAAVEINGKRSFLIPTEGWLERNTVDFKKEYKCARLISVYEDPYSNIPVYVVSVLEDEARTKERPVVVEPVVPEPKTNTEPEKDLIAITVSVLKTVIVLADDRRAEIAESVFKLPPKEVDTGHLEENEKEQLRIEAKVRKIKWMRVGNTLIFLHKKRLEGEAFLDYEVNIEHFIAKIDFASIMRLKYPPEPKEKKGPAVIVAESTKKKRGHIKKVKNEIPPNPPTGTEEKEEAVTTITEPPKRKRGRPRKS